MTVSRRAIVSVAIGLCFALSGCSAPPGSPSPPPPRPTAKVGLTASSVTAASIAPDTFMYTFKLQLTDSGGVSSTVRLVDVAFDNGDCDYITGEALGQNRRLTASGTLDLELACVPVSDYFVGNQALNAYMQVTLSDDNGNLISAKAQASIDKF